MEYQIIKSSRSSVSVEITKDLRIVVRAPYGMSGADIEKFVLSRRNWIEKSLEKMKLRIEKAVSERAQPFSKEEIKEFCKEAKEKLPPRVEFFASQMGLRFKRISIRTQRTRWGSCSSRGNLNFNCLLVLCPDFVSDYVIIHELCHLKQLNHSPAFWGEVEKYCPDYKEAKLWLKNEGSGLIARIDC